MTTTPSFGDAESGDDAPTYLCEPGDLFAALPALIGYHPHGSLLLLSLGGLRETEVLAVMRHDLVLPDSGGGLAMPMQIAIEQFAAFFDREESAAAIALVVDADADAAGHGAGHREIAEQVATRLSGVGTQLLGCYVTYRIDYGMRWWSVMGERESGSVADPASSPVTMAQVLAGRQIRSSRAELSDIVAVDPKTRDAVAVLLRGRGHASAVADNQTRAATCRPRNRRRTARRQLRRVVSTVAEIASGAVISSAMIADVTVALRNRRVRDALLALSAGSQAEAAELLWIAVARSAPDPERADAATLLGYTAYLRGDGALASVALDAALSADPDHTLARLLEHGIGWGLHPDTLWELSVSAYQLARWLGITLPPIAVDDEELRTLLQ